jgi:hypothetical protein
MIDELVDGYHQRRKSREPKRPGEVDMRGYEDMTIMNKSTLKCLFAFALLLVSGAATIGAEEAAQAFPAAEQPALYLLMGAGGTCRTGDYGAEFYSDAFIDRGVAASAFFSVNVENKGFSAVADLAASNDGKYGAALADIPGGNLYGFYLLMREGGLRYASGPLAVELGRFRTYDEVEGPYSLFLNSGGISSTTMSLSYDDGFFFYKSRWLGLNHDSAAGLSDAYSSGTFPERGATIKSTGLKIGEMRFGFQDAMVYAGRWFDYEYFLSPLPMYFTQYCRGTGGAPWATDYDDNTIMGFFWDWKRPGDFSAYAQFLLDDFGLGAILPSWPDNPWQIAASLGGRKETALGSFGAYAAMATKYTFEPSNASKDSDAYGYSYYPETRFSSYWQDAGTPMSSEISVEENEIGYKYGENNLALQADWKGKAAGLELGAALEFRLSGSNSPANPGQDDAAVPSNGTKWLDDAVLEKRFMFSFAAAKRLGAWRLYGTIDTGVAFDALRLDGETAEKTSANDIAIYRPVAGNTQGLFSLSLGATYRLDVKRRQ